MFNIANLLTSMNLICGMLSILFCFSGQLDWAVYAIFAGAFFDFSDGFVARRFNLMSPMGKQLDSLSDLVTFGVAPGFLMFFMLIIGIDQEGLIADTSNKITFFDYYILQEFFTWVNASFYHIPNKFDASIKFLPLVAFLIPFFSLFRLAKFNIDETQSVNFSGFPTPLIAIIFCFFPLYFSLNLNTWTTESSLIHFLFDAYTLSAIIAIFSICMLLPIPLMSLKIQKTNPRENQLKLGFLIISALSIPFLKVLSIPFILTLYLIVSIYHSIKKNKDEI
jgi:CDP-diacylglycerol--serine O-phosphatidyltransferase|tara:strand:+ start:13767 stop:14603 length:837 start_codon:yes stop_codon:yes gene_type:complete